MTSMGTDARRLSLRAHFGANRHADSLPILYVALFQGDPFGPGVEPSSTGGYARVAINNDATLWGTVAVGQTVVQNLVPVQWPVSTGLWSITTALNYWAVFDNAAGGNIWYAGSLSSSGTITITGVGDQARLPANAWAISQAG